MAFNLRQRQTRLLATAWWHGCGQKLRRAGGSKWITRGGTGVIYMWRSFYLLCICLPTTAAEKENDTHLFAAQSGACWCWLRERMTTTIPPQAGAPLPLLSWLHAGMRLAYLLLLGGMARAGGGQGRKAELILSCFSHATIPLFAFHYSARVFNNSWW